MKTKDLRPNAAILIAVEIANAIEKNIPTLARLLERYQAHQVDEYFVNFTQTDIDFLASIACTLKTTNCVSHLPGNLCSSNLDTASRIFDKFDDPVRRELYKHSFKLLVCLRLAEIKSDETKITALRVGLEEIAVELGVCKQCDFCSKCALGEKSGSRTYFCKEANPNCPQERCDDFSNRLISKRA